jgi:hypothetical protein
MFRFLEWASDLPHVLCVYNGCGAQPLCVHMATDGPCTILAHLVAKLLCDIPGPSKSLPLYVLPIIFSVYS